MLYSTTCAILYKGDRIERGAEIEMDEKEAVAFGADLVAVGSVAETEPEPEEDVALEDMSHDELKAKAKTLELKATGTKADLIERITLHLEGGEAEPEEESDEVED